LAGDFWFRYFEPRQSRASSTITAYAFAPNGDPEVKQIAVRVRIGICVEAEVSRLRLSCFEPVLQG